MAVGPVSEFNLDYDPEAAKYVLENIPMTRWVTWEVGLSTTRSWEGWHSILEKHSLTAAGSSVRLSARSNCGVDDADDGVNLAALVLEMEKYLIEKWPNNGTNPPPPPKKVNKTKQKTGPSVLLGTS